MAAICSFKSNEARIGFASRGLVECHFVNHALGNDQVIARTKFQRSKSCLQRSASKVNEQTFIGLAILEVVGHCFSGNAREHFNIAISKQHNAASDWIAVRFHARRLNVAHAHDGLLHIHGLGFIEWLPANHLRGWMNVVERARWPNKPLGAEDFFGVERAVGSTKLNVSLRGKFAHACVVRHGKSVRNCWQSLRLLLCTNERSSGNPQHAAHGAA